MVAHGFMEHDCVGAVLRYYACIMLRVHKGAQIKDIFERPNSVHSPCRSTTPTIYIKSKAAYYKEPSLHQAIIAIIVFLVCHVADVVT